MKNLVKSHQKKLAEMNPVLAILVKNISIAMVLYKIKLNNNIKNSAPEIP